MVSWGLCESAGPLNPWKSVFLLSKIDLYICGRAIDLFFSIAEFVYTWKNSRSIFSEVTKSLNLS